LGQVVSQRELISRRGEWKRTGEGVVCAYGAFDLLHPGHIRLLEQARDFGNHLAVAVESDELVRRSTSHSGGDAVAMVKAAVERPITPAAERAEIVAALSAVDFAAVIEEPLDKFLQSFRPDVFVRGDDESEFIDVSSLGSLKSALDEIGCRLVRLPIEPGYSTDRLIKRISGHRA
jgi:cytidyltransferase-like protein